MISPCYIGVTVFGSVLGAGLLAMRLRASLPPHHLSADTKDTVKLTMGLVATLTALVLGLLVASAKGTYDTQRSAVITMGAKLAFLDRLLVMYGPETAPARESLREAVMVMKDRLWPEDAEQDAQLVPHVASADVVFRDITKLTPQNDEQRDLKTRVLGSAYDLGQMRWLLSEQAGSSISTPLLVVVICWLAILFFSFGLFAPGNGTVIAALTLAAISVGGAIFLILELDQPFSGLLHISSQSFTGILNQIGK